MLPLIPIAIAAAASYLVGKSLGKDEGYEEGYEKGLKKKIIIELRKQCPPEFRDRVRYAKNVREHGENQATVELRDIKNKVLYRDEVKVEGCCKVFKENQYLFL